MSSLSKIITAFEAIKTDPSRLAKDKILSHLLKDKKAKEMLREILVYTFHPYWNYWVKIKKANPNFSYPAKDKYWREYKERVLDQLKDRQITGDEARNRAQKYMDHFPRKVSSLFQQVINRDIKIGMQLRSFEKHFGELVPKFSPMLASQWDGKEINEEVAIEPKLDGLRCFAIFPKGGEPTTVSRNGRPIYNTEKILEELKSNIPTMWLEKGLVIDGELLGSEKSWGSGISAAHSKNKKVNGLRFAIFDMLTQEEWEDKKSYREYSERRRALLKLDESKHITIVNSISGKFSAKKIKAMGDNYIESGLEGIIIKRVRGRYTFKRSDDWLKYKFKRTDDFLVKDRLRGKAGTKNENLLGAIVVEGYVDNVKVRSEVGQGFTDATRKKLWKMPWEEFKNLVVEVEHYGVTDLLRLKKDKNKVAAIRNGVFLKIREDKMER